MDDITRETLAGKPLPLPPEGGETEVMGLRNGLRIPVAVTPWSFDAEGVPRFALTIKPGEKVEEVLAVDSYALVEDAIQGAFIGVMHLTGQGVAQVLPSGRLYPASVSSNATLLLKPGDIGPIPLPTTDIPLPNDSTAVLVGAGMALTGNVVARTQQYRRTADSMSLAPGEERNISITTLNGMQEESSDTTTVATSVNASASAGWGPVSASVDASLSTSSTLSHTYTVSASTQRFDEVIYKNTSEQVETLFAWQLFDVVTIHDPTKNNQAIATLVSARPPAFFMGPYHFDNPPALTDQRAGPGLPAGAKGQ